MAAMAMLYACAQDGGLPGTSSAGKTQKAIFLKSGATSTVGLVQQTVQIVVRFTHTI